MEAGRPTLIACGLGSQTVQKGGGTGTRLVSLCFLDADATWPVHSHLRCQASLPPWAALSGTMSRRQLLHPEAAFSRALITACPVGASLAESAALLRSQQLLRLLPAELKLH